MEADGFLSAFCAKTMPPMPTFVEPFSLVMYPPHSSCSFSPPRKFVSFKMHHLITSPAVKGPFKTLGCVNNTAKGVDAVLDKANHKKPEVKRKKLAVFVSGGGSNFKSIHKACIQKSIHGDIVALVTNKHGCGGAEYARNKKIPVILFPRAKDEPKGLAPSDLVAALRRLKVDFILLAGYLKLIPAELIRAYPRSILNIHPSLLPAFGGKGYYGMKVHKAVIDSGARYSGPTIHVVDEHYDTGRILAQRVVPVLPSDTAEELAARVLQEFGKMLTGHLQSWFSDRECLLKQQILDYQDIFNFLYSL